jgi:fructose-1,6-bisphosphatase
MLEDKQSNTLKMRKLIVKGGRTWTTYVLEYVAITNPLDGLSIIFIGVTVGAVLRGLNNIRI